MQNSEGISAYLAAARERARKAHILRDNYELLGEAYIILDEDKGVSANWLVDYLKGCRESLMRLVNPTLKKPWNALWQQFHDMTDNKLKSIDGTFPKNFFHALYGEDDIGTGGLCRGRDENFRKLIEKYSSFPDIYTALRDFTNAIFLKQYAINGKLAESWNIEPLSKMSARLLLRENICSRRFSEPIFNQNQSMFDDFISLLSESDSYSRLRKLYKFSKDYPLLFSRFYKACWDVSASTLMFGDLNWEKILFYKTMIQSYMHDPQHDIGRRLLHPKAVMSDWVNSILMRSDCSDEVVSYFIGNERGQYQFYLDCHMIITSFQESLRKKVHLIANLSWDEKKHYLDELEKKDCYSNLHSELHSAFNGADIQNLSESYGREESDVLKKDILRKLCDHKKKLMNEWCEILQLYMYMEDDPLQLDYSLIPCLDIVSPKKRLSIDVEAICSEQRPKKPTPLNRSGAKTSHSELLRPASPVPPSNLEDLGVTGYLSKQSPTSSVFSSPSGEAGFRRLCRGESAIDFLPRLP